MASREIEVLLVNSPENIYYLTAFQTTGFYMLQSFVLPLSGDPMMFTREAEAPWVKARSWIDHCVYYSDHEDPLKLLSETLCSHGFARAKIAVEKRSWYLTVDKFEKLKRHLPSAAFVDGSGIVEGFRVIKSPRELEYIQQAAAIVDKAMATALEVAEAGRTENELAAEIYKSMMNNGSAYPAEHPYVCSGKRTGIMHATYENRRIMKGDLVFFEIPACVNRYHAAMMRTVSLGRPSARVSAMADAAIQGLQVAIDSIRPGRTSGQIDYDVRSQVSRLGFADAFRHRTGYSIGLAFPPDWGEAIISIQENGEEVIKPGMVFHVILSLRLEELGGTGFSETIEVTSDGAKVLGDVDRHLLIK